MYGKKDLHPKGLQIVALLRDWSVYEARYKANYTPNNVIVVLVPMWENTEVELYVSERIKLFKSAWAQESTSDLPLCTDGERWAKTSIWFVKENGHKPKAFKTAFAAEEYAKTCNGEITKKEGASTRCEKYCPVKNFCAQKTALDLGFVGVV